MQVVNLDGKGIFLDFRRLILRLASHTQDGSKGC
jgi:hypothetical protein